MSRKSCSRKNCNEVMCEYLYSGSYVCEDCINKFKSRFRGQVKQYEQFIKLFERFKKEPKVYNKKGTVEDFLNDVKI